VSGATRVAVLTPPGTGAIATVELSGPHVWELVRSLFQPAGKPLPDTLQLNRFWFGKLGKDVSDEVILAVIAIEPVVRVEVHCHGGRRVVQWVVEQFTSRGAVVTESQFDESDPWQLLTRTQTLRTASIMLDQAHGAFSAAIQRIQELLGSNLKTATGSLHELVRFAGIGRHLVEPWKVVIAGPPNVGKSSLMNALAGFQRAIVSEIAGTTRDVVSVPVAFDGWPVELTDTAGLRTAGGLEAEGIERAKRVLGEADLVIWVMDSSQEKPAYPDVEAVAVARLPLAFWLFVSNKSDISTSLPSITPYDSLRVSATTKAGITELISAIVSRLVPAVPPSGAAIPFTPQLVELVIAAYEAMSQNRIEETIQLLRATQPNN
jgi:tRNA modification GTPase